MKFTLLTAIIISAPAMAGIASSNPLLGRHCNPPSEHSFGLLTDLRMRTYDYPQNHYNARWASTRMNLTTATIARLPADLQARSQRQYYVTARTVVS
ncbi:uncharacterized protein EDB93DRAFT_824032 [Suillus bovinus]|uniref:uncharacterized protein n=1 Tax=Suillus bovinus TaxID=48563 RepID=UPI001B86ACAB|nr:uncharacterized protein EDB93DRAFT_824032 [Suillus bovinus]KAG2135755.1 hypothetical protein EDB93DRAFT_824032 [Suillus bovinus]